MPSRRLQNTLKTLSRHLLENLRIPSRHHPDTFQTLSSNLIDIPKIFDSFRQVFWPSGWWVGGWVAGNQVENKATMWSNLPDCKISSQVEIPKLDPSVAKNNMNSIWTWYSPILSLFFSILWEQWHLLNTFWHLYCYIFHEVYMIKYQSFSYCQAQPKPQLKID